MKVFIYYNIRKKTWSIKALEGSSKGRVIGHSNQLSIHNATFKVSQAGRNRVLAEKRKNVHAGVVGDLRIYEGDYSTSISYNPYKSGYFYNVETNEPLTGSKRVSFNNKLVTAEV